MIRLRLAVLGSTVAILLTASPALGAPVSGAIFTTVAACDGTNVNIYSDKDDVYLDGGPVHEGAAGLPNGEYYVKVTEPDGTLLGTSIGSGDDTPVVVVGGEFVSCYQLSSILIKDSDASAGYDTSTNGGNVYKVWVCTDSDFTESNCKTDNFKVIESPIPPEEATLNVIKFYDANANGINDDGIEITGWKINIHDDLDIDRFTPVSVILAPDTYTVTEYTPVETNWISTTDNPVIVVLADGDETTVEFGNLCLGPGGGHTLGYWSNRNGQATMNDSGGPGSELTLLSLLNLKNAIGADFNPTTYAQFRTWLLHATAVNMAYMLSAQLAAMELNVEAGFVSGSALVYAPDVDDGDPSDFLTISSLMTLANTALGADGYTPAGDPNRDEQEDLKDALDAANNNLTFVQDTPCPFSF
ncbi:MAG: hypothetical protein WEE67_08370 [Chloroflexota bacterium]